MVEIETGTASRFEQEPSGESSNKRNRQLTFARMIAPDNWGIEPGSFSDVTREEKQFMTIDTLRDNLLYLPKGRARTAGYVEGETRELIFVALTPLESKIVGRSAKRLGQTAVDKTLASRIPRDDYSVDVAAAERSALHVVGGYQERMSKYLENVLKPDRVQLYQFREYAEHYNLNRLKKSKSQQELSWLMTHIIEDTFLALRGQLEQSEATGWSSHDDARARRALEYRLFAEGDTLRRVNNWRKLLDFEIEYNQHKTALFLSKIWDAKKYSRQ